MDKIDESHAEEIEKLKQEIRKLDLNKSEKIKFDELLILIRELQKNNKENTGSTGSGTGKDYEKEIKELQKGQENMANNYNSFVETTNGSLYVIKEDLKT